MPSSCRILADSITARGHRLTTVETTLPRIILAELNTHKMLSKNSASSRAIPVEKRLAAVEANPFIPEAFGRNRSGMQHDVVLEGDDAILARNLWEQARDSAVTWAGRLAKVGVHKQLANRLLEPFSWHVAIVSGTDWENFIGLRVNPAAQGEFQTVARDIRDAMAASTPVLCPPGKWHLPLTPDYDVLAQPTHGLPDAQIARISAGRCARVSYLTHDGQRDPQKDLDMYDGLVKNRHLSPLEHQARPMTEWELEAFSQVEAEFSTPEGNRTIRMADDWLDAGLLESEGVRLIGEPRHVHYCGNLNGWVQLRKLVPGEAVFTGV